jgi:hypothetical protein
MLEWTGERFLPWLEQSLIAYEHLHRYAYATTFVKGKRVLDLASGEGYGSKMMSATASSVVESTLTIRHWNMPSRDTVQQIFSCEGIHFQLFR